MNKTRILLTSLLLVSLSSCGEPISSVEKQTLVNITLMENDNIQFEKTFYQVEYNSSLEIPFSFAEGMFYKSCSYHGSYYKAVDETSGILVLENVKFPDRISIQLGSKEYGIEYHLNGGEWTFKNYNFDSITRYYDLSHHVRANTELGYRLMKKDGYLLTGWNTASDYSGTRIGLGSRASIQKDTPLELFAQWEEVTPIENFQYSEDDTSITLNSYIGSKDIKKLVIPETINNKPVKVISASFASDLNLDSLVLPESIRTLTNHAFMNCQIEEITFFDSIAMIQDGSFDDIGIKTWHINAATSSKLTTISDNSYFAEDIDHLIMAQGKKKMLFFAGCSMSYGLKSPVLQDQFTDYSILNLGVIGGTNAAFQFDIITKFIESEDIFIHAPEVGASYQLMADTSSENRMFVMVENNYDLLSLTDMSKYVNSFNTFREYLAVRESLSPVGYERYNSHYNEYGDITILRDTTNEVKSFNNNEYSYRPGYVTKDSMDALYEKYQMIQNKGAEVLFSYSPINIEALTFEEKSDSIWDTFAGNVNTYLKTPHQIDVISDVDTYLLDSKYFYDADYHLNDEGALLRTQYLIKDIQSYFSSK